jgi:hypothetical protein
MALRPETVARLQGILDGVIKVDRTPLAPADFSKLSQGTRDRLTAILDAKTPEPQEAVVPQEPEVREPDARELRDADAIIAAMAKAGHGDYSAFRREIALDIYTTGHYEGNGEAVFEPGLHDSKSKLVSFTVYQEDYYDQGMSEDEQPAWENMIAEVPNGYLYL